MPDTIDDGDESTLIRLGMAVADLEQFCREHSANGSLRCNVRGKPGWSCYIDGLGGALAIVDEKDPERAIELALRRARRKYEGTDIDARL